MKYNFTKEQGKIKWHFPALPDWYYEIKEVKKKRSTDQNSYYWASLQFICDRYYDFWYIYTSYYLHDEIFKKYLIKKKRIKSDYSKKCIYVRWSTTDLNTKEFSKYFDMIRALFEHWAMEKIWMEQIDSFVIPDASHFH